MNSRHLKANQRITKSKSLLHMLLYYLAEASMRLAQIGDQAFGLTVTDLIQNLYPYLRVGRAAVRQCVSSALGLSHGDYLESERSHKAQKPDRRDVMSPLSPSHEAYKITYSQLRIVRATHEDQSPWRSSRQSQSFAKRSRYKLSSAPL